MARTVASLLTLIELRGSVNENKGAARGRKMDLGYREKKGGVDISISIKGDDKSEELKEAVARSLQFLNRVSKKMLITGEMEKLILECRR